MFTRAVSSTVHVVRTIIPSEDGVPESIHIPIPSRHHIIHLGIGHHDRTLSAGCLGITCQRDGTKTQHQNSDES